MSRITKICTGCGACCSVCPKQCITMKKNRFSELIPEIDRMVCVNCGLCKKVCPQNTRVHRKLPTRCYVAWSNNDSDLIYSSSGGISAAIARLQLKKGNKVYGCDYNENGDLQHFCVSCNEDIERIQSSKYTQSKSYVVFKEIKLILGKEEYVVFVGTPCQVAGLKQFLKKDYPNLLTIDLVCHGTPPSDYLKEHINSMGITTPFERIRFRGEYNQQLAIWKKGKIVYKEKYTDDLFFSAFYKNKISMEACYNCQYANSERVSDITIGDFWGLGKLNHISPKSNRPSLVLINTDKGMDFFESIKQHFSFEERSVDEGIKGNGRLNSPPGKSKEAVCFRILYPLMSFKNAVIFSDCFSKIYRRILLFKNKFKLLLNKEKISISRNEKK